MRAEPVRAGAVASIDRLSARRKSRKRKARVVRTKRSAILALRSCSVELAPADPVHRSKPPILLQGVLVEKERTPKGAAPIKWVLLTTLAADTPRGLPPHRGILRPALAHQGLAPGPQVQTQCGGDRKPHRGAYRPRAAAINLVIAWRIMLMTPLGRNHPDLPPGVLFSELEIDVLKAFAAQQGVEAPDTLAKAIRVVARIGGTQRGCTFRME